MSLCWAMLCRSLFTTYKTKLFLLTQCGILRSQDEKSQHFQRKVFSDHLLLLSLHFTWTSVIIFLSYEYFAHLNSFLNATGPVTPKWLLEGNRTNQILYSAFSSLPTPILTPSNSRHSEQAQTKRRQYACTLLAGWKQHSLRL